MQKGVELGGRTWNMGRGRLLREQQKIWGKSLSQGSRPTSLRDREDGGGSLGHSDGGEVHARLDPRCGAAIIREEQGDEAVRKEEVI